MRAADPERLAGALGHTPLYLHYNSGRHISATAARPSRVRDRVLGDGLVPVDSALGRHPKPHWDLAIPEENRWVARNTGHLGLLDKPRVYRRLRRWLAE